MGACFGVTALLLSKDCCDPWYRRSVRVSMGHIFNMPVIKTNLPAALGFLRGEGVFTAAACVQGDTIFLDEMHAVPLAWALVVGSEHFGVTEPVRMACDQRIMIRMAPGKDSLNVSIAAGILLNSFCEG